MRDKVSGFTLFELLATAAISAIVIAAAVPSFQSQILNNRSIALGEDLASAINFARSEAVKRGKRVSICASKSSLDCDGVWTEGFIVFLDAATSDTEEDPEIETVLKTWGKQNLNAEISALSATAEVNFIRYTGLGTMARVTNNPVVITAQMKHCKAKSARKITVGLSGQVSVESVYCPST